MKLDIALEGSGAKDLVDFTQDVLTCQLEVIPASKAVAPRALLEGNHSHNFTWPCGRDLHKRKLSYPQKAYIPVIPSRILKLLGYFRATNLATGSIR